MNETCHWEVETKETEKTHKHLGCSYLMSVTSAAGLKKAVKGLVAGIKESGIECDAIAFRGMSGALVGPMVALELGKEFIMVRKRNANSHSSYMVEGNVPIASQRYIIVDDFISSGRTVEIIADEIFSALPRSQCVGIAVYYRAGGVSDKTWTVRCNSEPVPVIESIVSMKDLAESIKVSL